jgi:hypothetical protein
MFRHVILPAVILLTLTASAVAQHGPGRMSPQEASVIADYWIRSYLRRSAAPGEVQQVAGQLVNGPSPAHALAGLLSSREYYSYAGGNPGDFVRQLIEDVGHREASPYEVDARYRQTAGGSTFAIAFDFLRENPRNWWPGPAATPPRDLWYFYRNGGGDRFGQRYGQRFW